MDKIDDLFSNFERNHPIAYRFDKIVKKIPLCNYAPHHAITHPWLIIRDWGYEIYWAYQRVRYGCDYRVGWGLDQYIVEMMPRWIDLVSKSRCGIGIDYFEGFVPNPNNGSYTDEEEKIADQRFTDTLQHIKFSFMMAQIMNDNYDGQESYQRRLAMFNEGFELFHKYFWTLGD
jgi:hypothetical protein